MSLTTAINSFPVKSLSEFKGYELEADEYLVRKIEKGTGKESKGVLIPATDATQFVEALKSDTILNYMVGKYQELIEDVCKARINAGSNMLCAADYTADALEDYIASVEVSEGRVSKEKITAWFSASVSPVLYRAFAEKLGTQLTSEKANELLKMYQSAFCMLAKREYSFNESTYNNMQKAIALLDDSNMKQFAQKKLTEMAPKTVDEWGL